MVTAKRLPKLKYCGLTREIDVSVAIESGADAIGLNFYAPSPRYIPPEKARALSLHVAGRGLVVGVFVNATPQDVSEVVAQCPLDCIQLHGDETPDWLEQSAAFRNLRDLPIIRAIAWRGTTDDRNTVLRWTNPVSPRLLALLVDAYDPIQRGGTGKTARWDLLNPRPAEFVGLPVLLAGGLNEQNVAQAIREAKPSGLDLASGIEIAPGIKDPAKMHAIAGVVLPLLDGRSSPNPQ